MAKYGEYPESLPKWVLRDIEDMQTHYQFWRCHECKHLSPVKYCCVFCGHDPSDERVDADR